MGTSKVIAIILTLFSLGAIRETFRILTSDAPDVAQNRGSLVPMAILVTGVFVFFAVRFWRKASKEKAGRL
jgi:uncharacterized phage infection (PIP) family protein YhgE